jgi:hypothetical protein
MSADVIPALFVLGGDASNTQTSVISADDRGAVARRCHAAAKRAGIGDRILITFDLTAGGPLRRAATLLLLPLRLARLDRELAAHGCATTRYAVVPTLAAPSLVVELDSVAASYAATHLLGHGPRLQWVRAAMRWWLSFDPSMGGVVVVARR